MLDVITENIDIWSSAQIIKSGGEKGRSKNDELTAHGVNKLRELILEMAVRGKLVPQDPKDEPARALLNKIDKNKAELIKEKKIKKTKLLPDISDNEKPFELPYGWEYVRLNDLGNWGAGATPLRGRHDYYNGKIPWFKSGELISDYLSDSEEYVTELALKETSLRYNQPGDVLIAMYGATIGKCSILKVPATTNQAVCACTPYEGIANRYLLTLLKAYKNRFVEMGAGGAQPNISREKIIATVIALPPIAEQQRIAAKVDDLMILCDQLEQAQADNNTAHQTLVETLLGTLTSSADNNELQENWSRIEKHFDALFITEYNIEQLKQTILQLAVMGKLVPQDPKDEPASVLLKKITKEKERLTNEGAIKKQKSTPDIAQKKVPFKIPVSWKWIRLDRAGYTQTGGTPSKNKKEYFGKDIPFIKPGDIYQNYVDYENEGLSNKGKNSLDRTAISGSILMVCIGTIGKCNVIDKNCTFNQQINSITPYLIDPNYLLNVFRSNYFQNEAWERSSSTTIAILNKGNWGGILIPLTPLAEQRRIVSKVNELMALCDALKSKISDAQTTQVQFAGAIVEKAVGF